MRCSRGSRRGGMWHRALPALQGPPCARLGGDNTAETPLGICWGRWRSILLLHPVLEFWGASLFSIPSLSCSSILFWMFWRASCSSIPSSSHFSILFSSRSSIPSWIPPFSILSCIPCLHPVLDLSSPSHPGSYLSTPSWIPLFHPILDLIPPCHPGSTFSTLSCIPIASCIPSWILFLHPTLHPISHPILDPVSPFHRGSYSSIPFCTPLLHPILYPISSSHPGSPGGASCFSIPSSSSFSTPSWIPFLHPILDPISPSHPRSRFSPDIPGPHSVTPRAQGQPGRAWGWHLTLALIS